MRYIVKRMKNLRHGSALLCALMMTCAETTLEAGGGSTTEGDSLQWPTSFNRGVIDLFRHHGIRSGSVVRGARAFEDWGSSSTVTWHIANNIAGSYIPTLSYSSSHDVTCTLEMDGYRYEGILKKGSGVLKHPAPAVTLDRIGVHRVSLSVSTDGPGNDFVLSGFRLRQVPGDVVMSKPVLIAGADWLKVQGSLQVLGDAIDRSDVEIKATIKPWPEGDVLWEGRLPMTGVAAGFEIDHTITGLQPRRWSPDTPNLYRLTVEVGLGTKEEPVYNVQSRFGFRDFTAKDGRFYLNGTPIFLRGKSIVPPGGGLTRGLNPDLANDPESIREYLLKLKKFNVNLIRAMDPVWLSLCDEVGLMAFTGNYGVPKWNDASRYAAPSFEESAVTYYKRLFAEEYMNHPSVVIWILSNEMPSAMTDNGKQYIAFLRQCYERLSKWDPTRAYIENAGFGLGQGGDVNDFHVYMGWYNGIVQSVYKFRYDLRKLAGMDSPLQPMAFTECIGAYTDELGRMQGTDKQISAGLMWAGNEIDVPEYVLGYQAYLASQFIEILRRIRPINPTIAGLMPFTTTATGWDDAKSVDEIKFNPLLTEAFSKSFQPVLLSFENWRPHVYAGERLRMSVHMVNDADDGRDIRGAVLQWQLVRKADDRRVASGSLAFAETVEHYAADTRELILEIGEELEQGQYLLKGNLVENGKTISSNDTEIWVESRRFPALVAGRKVMLFDPLGETTPMLEKAGLMEGRDYHLTTSPFAAMKKLDTLTGAQLQETLGVEEAGGDKLVAPSQSLLIIGSRQWVEPLRDNYLLMQEFIQRGGRVLLLHPNEAACNDIGIYRELLVTGNEWMGDRASVDLESLWHTSRSFGAWINPRRSDTGIFDSIDRKQLWLWSDPSGWDPSQDGLPRFEPVKTLMKLRNADALDSTAILADFGRGLEHVALAEVFRGEGSVILSGFDFERFSGFDPIADKVLRGVIGYAADDRKHDIVPVAKESTQMGSPSDEDGIIASESLNGLLLEYTKDYQVRRIAGPYWFNRLCHTKLLDSENKVRRGFMFVRPPSGTTHIVFHARRVKTRENRGRYVPEPLTITMGTERVQAIIPGEDEVEIKIPLPEGSGHPIRIDFEGVGDIGISRMSL